MPPIDNTTQVYANAGIARSYDYDSAVVGTSVTENFRPTQMDALLGGRFIKLCTSAGTAYNHALLMDLAFRTHDVKRIVYGWTCIPSSPKSIRPAAMCRCICTTTTSSTTFPTGSTAACSARSCRAA